MTMTPPNCVAILLGDPLSWRLCLCVLLAAIAASFLLELLITHWRRAFGERPLPLSDPGFWELAGENATDLVVFFHAYGVTPKTLLQVKALARDKFPTAHFFSPQLPFHIFSRADFNAIAKQVVGAINERWAITPYARVILIGHSLGALLARKVYVVACGETADAPFEETFRDMRTPAAWSDKVERIILLAAMNRGWRISHHLSISKAIVLSLGVFVGHMIEWLGPRPVMVMQLRRGAPALTQLRLQWLAMRLALKEKRCGGALTVQLLGSIDDLVSPEDNVDLVSGSDFVYLEVPRSDHLSLVYVEGDERRKGEPDEGSRAASRALYLNAALTEESGQLHARSIQVGDALPEPDQSIQHVIFVVHGIRDEGYWTQKIARTVQLKGKEVGKKYAMVTSSYGYFPMAPFLAPGPRRKKVEWLMDQYAQAVARYPGARKNFSCIAHSNGTYLIAKALKEYPAVRFEKIIFAGSVVRRGFDWTQFEGRVEKVLNYIATADWVVAFFPKLFEHLRIQDLGSAGHDGFRREDGALAQVRFVKGGHSAALDESYWGDLAAFIVTGRPAEGNGEQAPIIKAVAHFPLAVWLGIILLLVLLGWLILVVVPNPVFQTLAMVAYVWAIWKLLNWL